MAEHFRRWRVQIISRIRGLFYLVPFIHPLKQFPHALVSLFTVEAYKKFLEDWAKRSIDLDVIKTLTSKVKKKWANVETS